jgi:hypothetical protein
MKAAVLHELGKPPRCEEFVEPTAGTGEAIVRVLAASLKPIDKQLAAGSHYASPRELPVVCGADGVANLRMEREYSLVARAGRMARWQSAPSLLQGFVFLCLRKWTTLQRPPSQILVSRPCFL